MPRILELKVDERNHVWCNLGRIKEGDPVIVLTQKELEEIKDSERFRLACILQRAAMNPDPYEEMDNPDAIPSKPPKQ